MRTIRLRWTAQRDNHKATNDCTRDWPEGQNVGDVMLTLARELNEWGWTDITIVRAPIVRAPEAVLVIDDGGRAAAGFGKSASDCVVRSIAIASGRPYAVVYGEISAINAKMPRSKTRDHKRSKVGQHTADHGVYTNSALFKRYMVSLGFKWVPTMEIGSGCRVHLKASELPAGRIIARVSRHVVAVIDGVMHDTGDASRGGTRCVYGYWRFAGN